MVRLSIPVVLLLFLPSCLSATLQRDKRKEASNEEIVSGVVRTLGTITNTVKDITEPADAAKDAMKYLTKINSIFKKLGPMASGLSAIVDLIVLLTGKKAPDSAELKFMKEEFPKVHKALSSISNGLTSLGNQIMFQTAQINLHDTELSILVIFDNFNSIFKAPKSNARNDFMEKYEKRDMEVAIFNLIKMIKGELISNGQTPLLTVYKNHMKCNLRMMEVFSARILQLLTCALQVKVGYHRFKMDTTDNPAEKKRQEDFISEVVNKVGDVESYFSKDRDDCIKNMDNNVRKYAIETIEKPENLPLSYWAISKAIQLELQGKYYMYEFTVIYQTADGSENSWTVGDNVIKISDKKSEVVLTYRPVLNPDKDSGAGNIDSIISNVANVWKPNRCQKESDALKSCAETPVKKIVEALYKCLKKVIKEGVALVSLMQWAPYTKPNQKYGIAEGAYLTAANVYKIQCYYSYERRIAIVAK